MEDDKEQSRIMGELYNDLLNVLREYGDKHRGALNDATYMGAVNWLLADLMIATNTAPDEEYLDRLSRTIELVRTKNALAAQESIH